MFIISPYYFTNIKYTMVYHYVTCKIIKHSCILVESSKSKKSSKSNGNRNNALEFHFPRPKVPTVGNQTINAPFGDGGETKQERVISARHRLSTNHPTNHKRVFFTADDPSN